MHLPALVKVKKRLGRGIGGRGAKSGRGMKGQRARAGFSRRAGFEGGQTPLYQRLPKERGAKQTFASRVRHPARLTVQQLGRYADGDIVGPGVLRRAGLAGRYQRIKLVGQGVVDKKLTVRVHACTDHAREAVEAAGGTVELLTQA